MTQTSERNARLSYCVPFAGGYMGSAAWLLALVYTVYNVVFYTVVIKSHIYSIAWAPDVFLVSYLLLLTGSGKTRPHKIAHAF